MFGFRDRSITMLAESPTYQAVTV